MILLIIDLIGIFLWGLFAGAAAIAILAVIEITLSIIESVLSELVDEDYSKITTDTTGWSFDVDRLSKEVGENCRRKLNVNKSYARVQLLVDSKGEVINGKVVESNSNKVKEDVLQYEL